MSPSAPSAAPKRGPATDGAIKTADPGTLLGGRSRAVRGIDSDIDELRLEGQRFRARVTGKVTDAQVSRTIDAASTVTLTVHDPDDELLLSPLLFQRYDLELDGLWFRFVQASRQDPYSLALSHEDLPIALLRQRKGPKKALRDQMTRAEFVYSLIRDVHPNIAFYSPELHTVQPIAGQNGSSPTTNPPAGKADNPDAQAQAAQSAAPGPSKAEPNPAAQGSGLVGSSNGERAYNFFIGKGLSPICAAGILGSLAQESGGGDVTAINPDSIEPGTANGGIAGWTPASKLTADARAAGVSGNPAPRGLGGNGDLGGQLITMWYEMNDHGAWAGSPFHLGTYQQITDLSAAVAYFVTNWERASIVGDRLTPAKKALAMWGSGTPGAIGGSGGGTVTKNVPYAFEVKPNETYWDAIVRLAEEVRWRAFCANGVVYFVSDDALRAQETIVELSPDSHGVDWIGFDYDLGKPVTQLTINARARSWAAPPGTLIEIVDQGPIDGPYLVSQIDSPLMGQNDEDDTRTVTITAVAPVKPLPEPASATKTVSTGSPGGVVTGGGGYVAPFKSATRGRTDMGVDFTGSGDIVAIGDAKVLRTDSPGWPNGGAGPAGQGIAYKLIGGSHDGKCIYVFEGIRVASVGGTVKAGQTIGTFYPGSSIEIGWYCENYGNACASGPPTNYTEGQVTPEGTDFAHFLDQLGTP